MSRYESLFKQIQVFEKIAVYGDRKEFLNSFAQDFINGPIVFPDDNVTSVIGSVSGAAGNLARLLENTQQASTYELEMANKISVGLDNAKVPTYVVNKTDLDAKASPIDALLGNAIDISNKVLAPTSKVDPEAKEAADHLKNEAQRAISAITNFYRKNGIDIKPEETQAPAFTVSQMPAKPKTNIADAAKNLAKALEAKMSKLTDGPNRAAQLKELDAGIKTLQNYFRTLQNKVNIESYFARVEITNALQKIYSNLEYDDLNLVPSLGAGHNVPENPDSKI